MTARNFMFKVEISCENGDSVTLEFINIKNSQGKKHYFSK